RITLTTEIHLGEVEVGVHSGFRFKKPGTEQICSFGRILLLLCKEKRQGERMYRIAKFGQFWPVIIINLWIHMIVPCHRFTPMILNGITVQAHVIILIPTGGSVEFIRHKLEIVVVSKEVGFLYKLFVLLLV